MCIRDRFLGLCRPIPKIINICPFVTELFKRHMVDVFWNAVYTLCPIKKWQYICDHNSQACFIFISFSLLWAQRKFLHVREKHVHFNTLPCENESSRFCGTPCTVVVKINIKTTFAVLSLWRNNGYLRKQRNVYQMHEFCMIVRIKVITSHNGRIFQYGFIDVCEKVLQNFV